MSLNNFLIIITKTIIKTANLPIILIITTTSPIITNKLLTTPSNRILSTRITVLKAVDLIELMILNSTTTLRLLASSKIVNHNPIIKQKPPLLQNPQPPNNPLLILARKSSMKKPKDFAMIMRIFRRHFRL
jgi:hypothetical protein